MNENETIAKALGVRPQVLTPPESRTGIHAMVYIQTYPLYDHDLNLIREAEDALTEEERVWYIGELNKILIRDGAPWADLWAIRHAMAAQCAQALAKVLEGRK